MTKEDELKMKENEVLTKEDKILATIGLFKGEPRSVEELLKKCKSLPLRSHIDSTFQTFLALKLTSRAFLPRWLSRFPLSHLPDA